MGEYYGPSFQALKGLLDEGVYARAAAMTDERIMAKEERKLLIQMLKEIDPGARYAETLEEEVMDAYDTAMKRLRAFASEGFARRLEAEILGQIREIGKITGSYSYSLTKLGLSHFRKVR